MIINYLLLNLIKLILLLFYKNTKTIKRFDDYSKFYQMNYSYNCNKIYKPYTQYSFYKYIIITLSNPCDAAHRIIQRYYRFDYLSILYLLL